jgi:uncharacterized protein (TIGR00297 family)
MAVMLDKYGMLASALIGVLVFALGGKEYLFMMLVFLAVSVMATRFGGDDKKELGIYEYERGWENVLSNGIVPVICAFLHASIGPYPFIASVAAITADKFGSELGVLSAKKPLHLLGFKEVEPGTSGSMSVLGTLMSFSGALIIGASAIFVFGVSPSAAVMFGLLGLLGSVVDSLAGVPEEKGIGNKFTTNFLCSIAGAALGYGMHTGAFGFLGLKF